MSTAAPPKDDTKRVTVRLDVTYELTGDLTILDAMNGAKELFDKAKEFGAVEGHLMIGRQKFPLK